MKKWKISKKNTDVENTLLDCLSTIDLFENIKHMRNGRTDPNILYGLPHIPYLFRDEYHFLERLEESDAE